MKLLLVFLVAASPALAEVPVTVLFKNEQPCWAARKAFRKTHFLLDCQSFAESRFAFSSTYVGKTPVGKALSEAKKIKGVQAIQVSQLAKPKEAGYTAPRH